MLWLELIKQYFIGDTLLFYIIFFGIIIGLIIFGYTIPLWNKNIKFDFKNFLIIIMIILVFETMSSELYKDAITNKMSLELAIIFTPLILLLFGSSYYIYTWNKPMEKPDNPRGINNG